MTADYVVAASAAVIVAASIVLASLLYRYQKLVDKADKSSRLAKDVWDSVNSRFSVVDGRIIDLMARVEVLSSRSSSLTQATQPHQASVTLPSNVQPRAVGPALRQPEAVSIPTRAQFSQNTETEARVLRFLVEGPRTSAQIKDEVGRSREHTARMLKELFDRGFVIRNDRNKPYVYEITDTGRAYVAS